VSPAKVEFDLFLSSTDRPWCWYCGRRYGQSPKNWHAPFIIERAHIVNHPRRLDRRVCVLLCSMCHRVSHGARIKENKLPQLTVGMMVALKRLFDAEYLDLPFMAKNSIRAIPEEENPWLSDSHREMVLAGNYFDFRA
jgi:hypothetical protein